MTEAQKIEALKDEISSSIYSKYQTEAYFLRNCNGGYNECEIQEKKMLLQLLEYQIKGSYINCKY